MMLGSWLRWPRWTADNRAKLCLSFGRAPGLRNVTGAVYSLFLLHMDMMLLFLMCRGLDCGG